MSREFAQTGMSRRSFLGLTAIGAAAMSGCSLAGGSSGGNGELTITAATYMPPSYKDVYPTFEMFMNAATDASGDQISFDFHGSGTLLAADELITGLTQSVTDLAFQVSSYIASTYPIMGSYALPFIVDDHEHLIRALAPDGELYSIMNEQLGAGNLHVLGSVASVPQWLWTVNKPVTAPEDLQGLRIRTAGEVEGRTIETLGGSAVAIASEELHEALQRGTVDGVMSYPGTIASRGLHDILNYGTIAAFSAYSMDAYVRNDWFETLDSYRDALEAGGRAFHDQGNRQTRQVHDDEFMPIIEGNVELTELNASQLREFRDAGQPVFDWWSSQLDDGAVASRSIDLLRQA